MLLNIMHEEWIHKYKYSYNIIYTLASKKKKHDNLQLHKLKDYKFWEVKDLKVAM